jgi:uncharacterized protein (TIRG00374 family)
VHQKKWLAVALKLAVSCLLIWYLLGRVDLEVAKQRLLDADKLMVAAALAIIGFQFVISGCRWGSVLRFIGECLPFLETIRLLYISSFFGQAMPSSLGADPIRIYMAYKDGMPLSKAINSVILDRAVTLVGLVLLAAAMQPILIDKLDPENAFWVVWGMATTVVGSVGVLAMVMFLDRLPDRAHRWRIVRGLAQLADDTRRVFLAPKSAAVTISLGVLTHVNVSFYVLILANALSIEVTMLDCLVLMPPVLLITTLPISIAGWGLRESAMVVAFGLIGVPFEAAFVLSVTVGLASIAAVIPGGLIWLVGRRNSDAGSLSEVTETIEGGKSQG